MPRTYLKKALKTAESDAASVTGIVQGILDEIETGGEAAAKAYAEKFDRYHGNIVVTRAEIEAAAANLPQKLKDDIRFAHDNIRKFAEAQIATLSETEIEIAPGFFAGQKIIPCQAAGCYVPGGRYSHVASAIMTVTTAKVAGCQHITVASPPRPETGVHPAILYTADLCGADSILAMGGVQGVASMAFGLFGQPKADILVGPGNQFVAEAKRILFGRVGIDMFAGPTDSLVIADANADPEIVAADLVGQAEHGYNSPVWLVTDSAALAEKVMALAPGLIDALPEPNRASAEAAWRDYATDARQRAALTADTLRAAATAADAHESAGLKPVLAFDYDIVLDGATLPRPVNYALVRIRPPEGVPPTRADLRPWVIIDPRSGQGSGIGGFKAESEVGNALAEGHPVYFVIFSQYPEPGQTLADVAAAEAEFLRRIRDLHPLTDKPFVTGNCQGGWATLLLAATNPDITGPIVVNGAPVAPWSGRIGENPMRYNGGVFGGAWVPMFLSDIGGGLFDGAHLVQNFELLNPARTMFRKYVDLYRDIDKGLDRFLEFETWWGGFFLLNEPEIRWIVEQLFVGNRLVKNEARLEPGRPVDLKAIRSPIIVFASHGDNITPPQQALNWITETYADVAEIRIRGQRIVYMVHEQVGHLGIFVSGSVAKREHSEMTSTLATIESLAPGLYEMVIEDVQGEGQERRFTVSFVERGFDDIRAIDDPFEDERPFAAVARSSEIQAQLYEHFLESKAAKEMIATAKAKRKHLMIGMNQRLMPPHVKAKEILDTGKLGKVLSFETTFKHGGPDGWSQDGAASWFFVKNKAVMGVTGDLGVHKADLMRYLLGEEFVEVTGFIGTLDKTNDKGKIINIDDNAYISMKSKSGTLGTMTISWTNYGNMEDNGTTLYCENGVMLISRCKEFGVKVLYKNGQAEFHKVGKVATNTEQVGSGVSDMFTDCIQNRKKPSIDGMEGYRAIDIIISAMESAKTGKAKKISLR